MNKMLLLYFYFELKLSGIGLTKNNLFFQERISKTIYALFTYINACYTGKVIK